MPADDDRSSDDDENEDNEGSSEQQERKVGFGHQSSYGPVDLKIEQLLNLGIEVGKTLQIQNPPLHHIGFLIRRDFWLGTKTRPAFRPLLQTELPMRIRLLK